MSRNTDRTTLLCLFHHGDQAMSALKELHHASIPQDAISVLTADHEHEGDPAVLATLGIPDRDLKHLQDGLRDGGTVLLVKALTHHIEGVERIFARHRAEKIDEAETSPQARPHQAGAHAVSSDLEVTSASRPNSLGPVIAVAENTTFLSQKEYPARGEGAGIATATNDPVSPTGTVLLVSQSEILSGEADVALEALDEEALAPMEVVVVPDHPREPIRPMEPASRYRQVD